MASNRHLASELCRSLLSVGCSELLQRLRIRDERGCAAYAQARAIGEFSVLDLKAELLQRQVGIEVKQVIYDAGKQVLAVVNGTIDAAVAQPPPVLQYVERGDLHILGVFGEQKPEGIDAPLFTEAGYDITEVPYEFVVGSKDMPSERVQVIHDAYEVAMESEEFQKYARKQPLLVNYVDTKNSSKSCNGTRNLRRML